MELYLGIRSIQKIKKNSISYLKRLSFKVQLKNLSKIISLNQPTIFMKMKKQFPTLKKWEFSLISLKI